MKIYGLTEEEVLISRKEHGNNSISIIKENSFFKILLETLGDPIIKILLIALGIKIFLLFKSFDWYETIGILISIFLASFVSTISEYGSEKAFKRLQEETSKIKIKVIRSSITKEINIDDIVVGDIVLLSSGDKIPADGELIKGELVIDESSLTGETKEIYKKKNDSLFRGSVIYSKTGYMKVTKVGDKTFYGRISKEIQDKSPESPLKIRLRHLAKIISRIGYIGALLGSLSYLFNNIVIVNNFNLDKIYLTITNYNLMASYILYALTLSVTIIIVAVPEGLPMMITLVLSSNMKKMLKDNVLVRKMVGIETAGSMNMLFFDKTGTITKGKPEVISIFDGNLNIYKKISEVKNNDFLEILKLSLVINNESCYDDKFNIVGGNITDKAILKFAGNLDIKANILDIFPFDSKNKYSSVTVKYKEKDLTLIKGAPELICKNCKYYYDNSSKRLLVNRSDINEKINEYVKQGFRVLTVATGDTKELKDLTLVCIILIKDEVRKNAKETIETLKKAKIMPIMLTGDNKSTAISIAKDIGLIEYYDDIILTSEELSKMSDNAVASILPNLKIIARSLPTDKSRLIKIAQESNYVVGMTGDGVNDAPALKKADVGFAIGSGTEVAKDASDIVILDDNIKSIEKAVLYGRTIFKSIRKFIIFQLSLNICAVLVSIIGPLLGINTPVTVVQMLWINMIMDTLAGLAFSYEAPLEDYMKEKPKNKDEKIINKYMKNEILLAGIYSAILSILFLKLNFFKSFFRNGANNEYLFTAFFGLFIFLGIFNSFNARTHRLNLLSNLYKNKVFMFTFLFIIIIQIILIYYGGDIFRTSGLTLKELEIMLLISFSIIPVDLIRKIYLRLKKNYDGV